MYLGWGVHTLVGGYLPWLGVTTACLGVPVLVIGYLPWLGGTYLGQGVPTLAGGTYCDQGVPTLVGGAHLGPSGMNRLKTLPSPILQMRSVIILIHSVGGLHTKVVRTTLWLKRLDCDSACQEASKCHTTGEYEETIACTKQSMKMRDTILAVKSWTNINIGPKQGYL